MRDLKEMWGQAIRDDLGNLVPSDIRGLILAVQRVESLCDEMDTRETDPWYWSEVTQEVRSAIRGEAPA